MIDKIISAIFLPALLMIFFYRVTFNKWVSFVLCVALIIVSAFKGYMHLWWMIVIEAASLTIGLYIVSRKKQTDQS